MKHKERYVQQNVDSEYGHGGVSTEDGQLRLVAALITGRLDQKTKDCPVVLESLSEQVGGRGQRVSTLGPGGNGCGIVKIAREYHLLRPL